MAPTRMTMRKQLRELKQQLPYKLIERRNTLEPAESEEEDEQEESSSSPNDINTDPPPPTGYTFGGNPFIST